MLPLQDILCSTISGRDGRPWFTLILVPHHFCESLSWQGSRSCCGHAAPPLLPHVPLTCTLRTARDSLPCHQQAAPATAAACHWPSLQPFLSVAGCANRLPGMWEVQRGIPRQPNSSPVSKIPIFSFVLAKICEEIRASSYTLTAFLSWHCKLGNRKGIWERFLKPLHRIGKDYPVKNIQAFLPPKTPLLFKEIDAWKFVESSLIPVPPNNYLAFAWPSLTLQTNPKTHPAAAILVYGLINIGK